MTAREHPEWMYSVPGPWAVRVRELEAALLESNDTAARLAPGPTLAHLLSEIDHARAIGLELPLNVEISIDMWISAGKPGFAP